MTLVTVLSIVAVVSVYAVIIGTFTGLDVTVGGMGAGTLKYSDNNADLGTWVTSIAPTDATWYTRLEIDAGGYSGPVNIAWHLEKKTGTGPNDWAAVPEATAATSIVLTVSGGNIYATNDGTLTNNLDWGTKVTGAGTYRVIAAVDSV